MDLQILEQQANQNILADLQKFLNGKNGNGGAKPTDDDLAGRWLAQAGDIAYGLADWRRYQSGLWPIVPKEIMEREIKTVLQDAKGEGIRPNASLLASVTKLAKVDVFIADDVWNSDPDYLVCKNGTLHIPTKKLEAHWSGLYAITGVDYDYDPHAKAPNWQRLLWDLEDSLSRGVVDFLQEFAGYALTIDSSHEIAVWLYGPPGSGKSTFLTGLQTMLGNRAGMLGLADIQSNQFALANLPGKTLAISTEQPGDYIASTHILNALISGEPVKIERKYRDAVEIIPKAKLCWAMNELPRVSDPNSGIFRRVKLVEFSALPEEKRNPELKEGIKTEGAGILNWALSGLARLRDRGKFEIPSEVVSATKDFQSNNDIPARFVEDACYTGDDTPGEPYRTQSSALYRRHKDWCIENGHKPLSSTKVAQDWRRLGFERGRINGKTFWSGVGLKAEYE